MARIYKEQATTAFDPTAPDTRLMEAFTKERAGAVKQLGDIADIQLKRAETIEKANLKEEKSLADMTKSQALQVYKNAQITYPNDPQKYAEMVEKGLKTVYDAVPDSDAKTRVQAEVSISGSGYNARVNKSYQDKLETVRNDRIKKGTLDNADAAISNSGFGLVSADQNLTPEAKLQQAQAYEDARLTMLSAYNARNNKDNNGNLLLSPSQIADIEDKWENFGYYSALDYAGDNIATNRKGVVALRNFAKNNPAEYKEMYGVSDDTYAKTIRDMDKVISNQTTAQDLFIAQQARTENTGTFKAMEIKVVGDEIEMNQEYNNLNDTIGLLTNIKLAEKDGFYAEKSEQKLANKQKIALSKAINRQVDRQVGVEGQRNAISKFFRKPANVGEVAYNQVNENITELSEMFALSASNDDDIEQVKADFYVQTLGKLQEAGISLTDREDQKSKDIARKVANQTMISYVEGVTGEKVVVSEEDANNPRMVRLAIQDTIRGVNNQLAQSVIDGAY
ncbi:MAG: hypothetical protein GY861_15925 [bacterium]|nr:hypothetical protein [bacterium]